MTHKVISIITAVTVSAMLLLSGCGENKPSNTFIKSTILDANPKLTENYSDIKINYAMENLSKNKVKINFTVTAKAKADRVTSPGSKVEKIYSKNNIEQIMTVFIKVWEKAGTNCSFSGSMTAELYGKNDWKHTDPQIEINTNTLEEIKQLYPDKEAGNYKFTYKFVIQN